MKMLTVWNIAPYSLVEVNRRFRGAYYLALIMEAVWTYETSVFFDETIRRYIPDDYHFQITNGWTKYDTDVICTVHQILLH
jgi:hypothetical protein